MPRPSLAARSLATLILPLLLLAAGPGAAQGAADSAAAVQTPVQVAALSARLYAAGVAAGDPVLVLAAARLRKTLTPAADAARRPDGAAAAPDTEPPLTWEDMAATAAALATEDPAVLDLIADLRAETVKGVSTGPVYNIGRLAAGGRDSYGRVPFRGGEYAEVYVEARSTVDLNLTVTDAQGRTVCRDTDASHIAYCGWRPDRPGDFTLRVENRGGAATGYALMTN